MRPLSAVIASALLCVVSAQQTPPTFRGRVDLVPLDVSVWDKDHNPVKGLTADKFTLLEDDKPRPIVTFAAIDIPDPPPPTATWMRDAPKDVETNDVTDRRLFMILVDDASFPDDAASQAGSIVESLKETARSVIRHLGPSDLAAVFFTGDNRRSQEFTADHSRLLAAVNGMHVVQIPPQLKGKYAVTVGERAVEALLGSTGRRKALVDITMFDFPWAGQSFETAYLIARAETTFEKAQRAGVNFYMVRPGEIREPDYWENSWFRRTAHETGGEAFGDVRRPGAAEQVATRIFEANSSYYILGYSSANLKNFHFIKVNVDVPGVTVRTREKYYWPDPDKPQPDLPPLNRSITGALPKSDVPMWTSPMVFATANLSGATITSITRIRLAPPNTPPPAGAPKAALETFDLQTRLFTPEGAARGSVTSQGSARVAGQTVDTELWSQIAPPKPGLYELRLSAHRPSTDLDGSVYVTIDVPDFAHAPVSLSSIVVSTMDWAAYGPRDEMAKFLPAPPTTQREFEKGERARAWVRVYQGTNKPVALDLHTRVIDEHDKAVLERTESLAPARFGAARSTEVRVDLPTSTLPPGQYLLVLETSVGKASAKRELRFSVR